MNIHVSDPANDAGPAPHARPRLLAAAAADRDERSRERRIWRIAAGCVAVVHVAAAWSMLHHSAAAVTATPPADQGAVMIELAPVVQQAASTTDAAVDKPQEQTQKSIEQPRPVEEKLRVPELAVPVPAVAPLPPPSPPRPVTPAAPAAAQTVEQTAAAPRSEQRAATSTATAAGAGNSARVADWRGQFAAALNRHKRYPRGVQATGMPVLQVRVEASGAVSGVTIVTSSGSDELDRAALEPVRRASPVPPPPDGAQVINFRMNFHR